MNAEEIIKEIRKIQFRTINPNSITESNKNSNRWGAVIGNSKTDIPKNDREKPYEFKADSRLDAELSLKFILRSSELTKSEMDITVEDMLPPETESDDIILYLFDTNQHTP